MVVTLVYATLIGVSTAALFREPATAYIGQPTSDTLTPQQQERALRAEAGAWELFFLALPWILILDPSSGHPWFFFAALLLNVATVYAIAAWLIPPPHRRGR